MADERLTARLFARAIALCLVAGYVDAIGYTELGGVFAANMTGNSVLLAIAAARGDFARASLYALTLAVFFAGALGAAALRRWIGRAAVPLFGSVVAILAASAIAAHDARLAVLALAMGLQGASVSRFGPVSLQTVVVTGTIVRLSETIVARAAPPPVPPEPGTARLHALSWIAYGAGAATGVWAERALGHPLWLAAALLFLVALDMARDRVR